MLSTKVCCFHKENKVYLLQKGNKATNRTFWSTQNPVFHIPMQYLSNPQCFPIKQRQKSGANLHDLRLFLKLQTPAKKVPLAFACSVQPMPGRYRDTLSFLSPLVNCKLCSPSFPFSFPVCHPHIWSGCPASPVSRSHLIY